MPTALKVASYFSTRDPRPLPRTLSFEDVLLAGLAGDGGLYVPAHLPALSRRRFARHLPGLPYAELAARHPGVVHRRRVCARPSCGRLPSRPIAGSAMPRWRRWCSSIERLWLLELFHGPTLAFKDLALQLVGPLFDAALARRHEHVTIIGATSGDTGSAALAACRDREAIDIFILYPHGRISEVQRRQMTTVDSANAHAIAIEGTFDDCQDLVKALFADAELRRALNLAAVNSINWARIAAQTVYYFAAGVALGAPATADIVQRADRQFRQCLCRARRPPDGTADRAAGDRHQSQRHPRPLYRQRRHGDRPSRAEPEPEHGHSGVEQFRAAAVRAQGPQRRSGRRRDRRRFGESAVCPADDQAWRAARGLFSAHKVDDTLTMQTIAETYARSGMLIDPHTAVAVAAARAELGAQADETPMVALATAHPAKVSRRGRARDRHPADTAAGAGRAIRKARAHDDTAERFRHRETVHSRPCTARGSSSMTVRVSTLANGLQIATDQHRHGRHGLARHLGRCRHPPRAGRRSTASRIFSSIWRSRGPSGAARSPSPRRSRRSAATSTPTPRARAPPFTPKC